MDNLGIGSINTAAKVSRRGIKSSAGKNATFNMTDSFTPEAREKEAPVDLEKAARSLLSKQLAEVEWSANIGDYLQNDPVLISGEIFHTIGNDNEIKAFSPGDGSKLWTKKIKKNLGVVTKKDGNAVILAADWDSHINVLDLKTGNKLWKRDATIEKVNGPPISGKDDSLYFVSGDSSIQAVDGKTGKKKWKTDLGSFIQGTIEAGSGDAIYINNETGINAIDTKSGKLKWESEQIESLNKSVVEGKNDTLVYTCHYGKVGAIDAGTGKAKWVSEMKGELVNESPVICPDGTVLVAVMNKDRIFAFDGETGASKWTINSKDGEKGKKMLTFPPAFDREGRIIVGDTAGRVCAIDTETGKEAWGYETGGGMVFGKPVLSPKGLIYANDTDGNLHALDSENGKPVWKCSFRKKRFTSPIILGKDGLIYSSTHEGEIFGIKGPEYKEKPVTPEEAQKLSIESGKGFVNIGGVKLKKQGS